jgi:hypothetical protein
MVHYQLFWNVTNYLIDLDWQSRRDELFLALWVDKIFNKVYPLNCWYNSLMSSSEISFKSDLRKWISIQLILVVFAFRFVTALCCAEASTQNSPLNHKVQFISVLSHHTIENYLSNIIIIYCDLSNDKIVFWYSTKKAVWSRDWIRGLEQWPPTSKFWKAQFECLRLL